MEQVLADEAKYLLTGLPHDQYLIQVGRIRSLKGLYDLPRALVAKNKEAHDRTERQRLDADQSDAARRARFLNSPYLDRTGRANGGPGSR